MKKIIFVILVLSLFLISGCYYAEWDTKDESTQSKVKSKVDSISASLDTNCQKKVKELVSNHLIISSIKETQYDNKLNNGDSISLSNFKMRKGSETGENVNYYYATNIISYSKQIIDKDGTILGNNEFGFKPTLKLSDINIDVDPKDSKQSFTRISWSGFTDEVKDIFGTDKITFKLKIMTIQGYKTQEDSLDGESDYLELDKSFKYFGYGQYSYNTAYLTLSPDIITNKIYDIIDYDFVKCNWIE